MSITQPIDSPTLSESSADSLICVPAPGLSIKLAVGHLVGIAFASVGVAFEIALLNSRNLDDAPAWLFHGFFCLTALIGCVVVLLSIAEMFRRFELHVDSRNLHCASIWGPFERTRSWPRDEIIGTSLRSVDAGGIGKPVAKLNLVLTDNRAVSLLPAQETSAIAAAEIAIHRLLNPSVPFPVDAPPLGGGLTVSETEHRLEITAGPISPYLVPGGLYSLGSTVALVDPIFSALLVAAVWKHVRNQPTEPIFWYITLGQMITVTVAGLALRRWIQGIARRRVDIQLDSSRIIVTTTISDPAKINTQQCRIDDVSNIKCIAIISQGESIKRPLVQRLELILKSGKPIELLYGRPREETQWIESRIRQHLELHSKDGVEPY